MFVEASVSLVLILFAKDRDMSREEDLYYNMDRSRLGLAVILNNLDKEQEPTKKDVEIMGSVLRDIGQNFNRHLNKEN